MSALIRGGLAALAFSALAAATPVPQDIAFEMVQDTPDPSYSIAVGIASQSVSYDAVSIHADATEVASVTVDVTDLAQPTTGLQRMVRRGNCATQPTDASAAPTYSPDAASAFASATTFGIVASSAPTPSGYDQTFANLAASNNAYGYLGFTTLQSYDTQACAAKCDKINGCMAVNIYFERDPSLDPGASCPNPSSVTTIKCVFWGGSVDASNANNKGQYRQDFQVLIAGSNGYVNKTLSTPPGYSSPAYLGNAAINATFDSQGYNTYMGSKIFTDGPFNASLCSVHCTSQTEFNLANAPTDGTPVQTCQFFNTYILYANGKPQGQYCALYSESWSSKYATNTGQTYNGAKYTIRYSYTFTNATTPGSPNKPGAIYQARDELKANTLQPYCSDLLGYAMPLTTVTSTATISPSTTFVNVATVTVTISPSTTITDVQTAYITSSPSTTEIGVVTATSSTTIVVGDAQPEKRQALEHEKRAASVPAVLSKYPSTVLESACSLVATQMTSTSTIVLNATTTAETNTLTLLSTATTETTADISTITSLSTQTVQVTLPVVTISSVSTTTIMVTIKSTSSSSTSSSSASSTSDSTTSTSATSSAAAQTPEPTASCDYDGQKFTAADGSQFLITCNKDYSGVDSNIVGINPVSASSYDGCLSLCVAQGSARCSLTAISILVILPGGRGWVFRSTRSHKARREFPTSLSSNHRWANMIYSTMAFSLVRTTRMQVVTGMLRQTFSPAPPSSMNGFYAHADIVVNLAGTTPKSGIKYNDACSVVLNSDAGTLYSGYFNYDTKKAAPSVNVKIDVSGTFTKVPTYLNLQVGCSGNYDMTSTFDNVVLNVFEATSSANAIVAKPKQVIVNGDFSNGANGWTFSGTSSRSSFDGSNGQGVVRFGNIDSYYTAPSSVIQTVPLIELGQTFSLSADVWAQVPSGTTCMIVLYAGNVAAWQMDNIGGYQSWNLRDLKGVANSDSTTFSFYSTCTGTAVPTLGIDNVVYWYNV
ncbi:hypothetical protein E4T49_02327 [Aureobasidium sp. EXF-10728]|nr:hypothetical protein E4T49_02327 [Aureobasidium sp. EXF-10728]